MPDHDNPIRNLVDSTRRCFSLLTGLFSSVVSSNSEVEEGSNLSVEDKGLVMAVEPIEISSSSEDSWDLEADECFVDDSVATSDLRRLPSWADSPVTSSAANGGMSQKTTFQVSTSNRNVSNPGRQNHGGIGLADHGRLSVKAPSRTFTPNGSSSHDYGQQSYGQVPKRSLPASLKPHVYGPTNLIGNLGSSQMRETYARSYPAQGISNHVKNQLGRGSDDELIMYDKNGSLPIPKPFMPRISPSTAQHTPSADPGFRSGAGEERYVEYDERLIYQAALQDLNQPKAETILPDGLLSVSLLRHQKIALAWMLLKEKSYCCSGGFLADDQGLGKTISMIALIQYQKFMQSKSKSEDVSHQTAEALNLDDEEENDANALGQGKQDEDSRDLILIPEASTSARNIQSKRPQAGTLVVCPASVLRQWARELEEKVAESARLKILIYHGGNRTKDHVELAKYDVVLTTYAIVANEVPQTSGDEEDHNKKKVENGLISDFSGNNKRKQKTHASKKRKKARKGIDSSCLDSDCGTLAKVRWLRVILDEAQTIKNHRTQVARACAGFKAKSRWCLSGTPIQNTIDDLFSYFRFLKYDPYTTYRSFCTTLKNPISRDSVQGYKKLYAVLRAVMLRRTKGTIIDGEPIIRLPKKTINLIQAEFSEEERDFYMQLEANSLSQFKAYADAGTLNQNYANILLMLLRLRQACDHPLLVTGLSSDSIGRDSMLMGKNLPKNMLINLMKQLDTSSAICCVCNDPPEDAIVTMCGHVFCYQCVSEYLRGDDNTCPSPECKELLGPDVIFSEATLRSCLYGNDHPDVSAPSEPKKSSVLQKGYSSSKIKAVMEILKSHCKSNNSCSQLQGIVEHSDIPSSHGKETSDIVGSAVKVTNAIAWSEVHTEAPKKAIVFSQWTGMLDLVEISLNQSDLRYRRLDGTMTLSARDKAVKEFNNDPEVTVMLMSLKAGNLGLNMVAATHVVLLDLWWNPTTEDQAIDRAHRIGQTQPVTVSRLTVKETVEERILALQEEKRKMVASAFGEDQSGGSGTRLTVEDLRFLFMGKQ